MNSLYGVVAVVGLVVITLVTRGFFLFSDRQMSLPPWLDRGLRHAPLAALVAVVAPDVVLKRGDIKIADQNGTLRALRMQCLVLAHLIEKIELVRELRIDLDIGFVAAGGHVVVVNGE